MNQVRLGYNGAPALAQLGLMRRIEASQRAASVRVVATGGGAFVGALWAVGADLQRCAAVLSCLPWESAEADLVDWIDTLTRGARMESLYPKLTILGLDILSGALHVFTSGPVAEVVRKAMGQPGWLAPVQEVDGNGSRLWIDAGPVPNEALPAEVRAPGVGGDTMSLELAPADEDVAVEGAGLSIMQMNAWYRHHAAASTWKCATPQARLGPLAFDEVERAANEVYRLSGEWFVDGS